MSVWFPSFNTDTDKHRHVETALETWKLSAEKWFPGLTDTFLSVWFPKLCTDTHRQSVRRVNCMRCVVPDSHRQSFKKVSVPHVNTMVLQASTWTWF
jgi:hypothetical protein